MAASSPTLAEFDVVTICVEIEGTEVTGRYEILSVQVSKAANRIPSARLVIRDGSASAEDFAASEAEDFSPGKKIVLKAGYHSDGQSIFEGLIVKQGIRKCGDNPSQLVVECRDAAIKMTVGRKSAYYTNLSDGEITGQIIAQYGLTTEVAATSPALPCVTQFNSTDWGFLAGRAQINGMPILVNAGKLTVKPPDLSQTPALSVTYGIDVLEFDLELDALTQFSSVECMSWDAKTQVMITADAEAGDINALGRDKSSALAQVIGAGTVHLGTNGAVAPDSLKAWAKAAMLQSELAKICGRIKFQGSAAILPGNLLEVNGFGARFNGTGYVGAVTHVIDNGSWTTEVSLGLDPEWFAADPAGWPPVVLGLQTGVVKQIDGDPDGQFRVLVTVPVLNADGEGLWARLGTFYASSNAGNFFYPEIGDEVILGFLSEDPRSPVILGSVYSEAKPAPRTPDPENAKKAIVTNGQLQILFDDKDKVLTIQTPTLNTMVFSDLDKSISVTDQHGNFIKLSADGITIHSVKNLTIGASQDISMEAQAGTLAAKGTNGVTVSGLKIALAADMELSAEGQATASLKSSGTTIVKGTMVMIN